MFDDNENQIDNIEKDKKPDKKILMPLLQIYIFMQLL